MDFRSTLSAVADYLPSDVENVLAAASAYLPDDLEKAISGAASAPAAGSAGRMAGCMPPAMEKRAMKDAGMAQTMRVAQAGGRAAKRPAPAPGRRAAAEKTDAAG